MPDDVTVTANVSARKIGIRKPRRMLDQNTSFDALNYAPGTASIGRDGHGCESPSKMRRIGRPIG
jgi:hypothetical protein